MLVLVLFILTGLLVAFICYTWWNQNYSRRFTLLKKIPSAKYYPIIGHATHIFKTPEQLFKIDRQLAKTYYPVFSEWFFNSLHAVTIQHPEDLEVVLTNTQHNEKSDLYKILHSWLGTGLLTSGGAKWHTRRKILTPAFHFSILQEFVPIFNKETDKLVNKLLECSTRTSTDVIGPITTFTLMSIAETSMGVKLEDSEISKNYKQAIYNFGYSFVHRIVRPWLLSDAVFFKLTSFGHTVRKSIQTLHDFSRNVIAERKRSTKETTSTKRMAMLDLLLVAKDNGADIDDEGIAEEVDTFMFEGHDTTTVAICHVLLVLANHPKVQEEIFEEIQAVLGTLSKHPTYSDLRDMTFMDRCVKECLRLFPSVPFIARKAGEDIALKTGYIIPKGTMVHIPIFDIHRNPEIFPDSELFDPDRFLPENVKNRHPFAYLVFSAGSRNCIGQKYAMLEIKAALCGILKSFDLESVDKIEDEVFLTDLVLRCKGQIKVKFVPRPRE